VAPRGGSRQRTIGVKTPAREPTMGDIAAHLGISRQLVSLVLRGAAGASAETRERVRQAAIELGYSPHIAARTLRQARSKYLGVAFNPLHATGPDIVASIYPAAVERGYNVVLSAQTSTRSTGDAVEELLGYRCEALILIGSVLSADELKALALRAPVPTVSVGAGRKNAFYDIVRSAGDVGIAQAVHHLAGLGHRDIAYVHSESMPPAELRRQGYLRAVAQLSLKPRIVAISGGYTEESGAGAAQILLADGMLPTAVVMGNDQAALGFMLVLMRAGIAIPAQVSVTGFDDSWVARLSAVDLTTIRQDPAEMGVAAVEAAVRRILRRTLKPDEFVITPSLVVRGSTAPPRRQRRHGALTDAGLERVTSRSRG
jgi:DNA-binding LacI/PurR family transcriptional regulator